MEKLAIVIFSCDKYKDLWLPFMERFEHLWNDCQYKVYIVSNYCKLKSDKVITVNVGEDVTWSANVKKALNKIDEDYVLTTFDDLFFKEKIDNDRVNNLFNLFIRYHMNYLRLNPTPIPHGKIIDDGMRTICKGEIYRSSAVLAIWKKDVLIDILNDEENAWQFEILGSKRTDKYDDWYSCTDYNIPYYNLVIKGLYERSAYYKLIRGGVNLSESRLIMSDLDSFKNRFFEIRSKLFFSLIPYYIQRRIREVFTTYKKNGR
jgi:hypothetical protein